MSVAQTVQDELCAKVFVKSVLDCSDISLRSGGSELSAASLSVLVPFVSDLLLIASVVPMAMGCLWVTG